VGLVLTVGIVSTLWLTRGLAFRLGFVREFTNRFASCASGRDSASFDENMTWLNGRIPKLSDELGGFGVVQYKPAFANYIHNNYALVPNTVLKMATGSAAAQDLQMTMAMLIQHSGRLEDLLKDTFARLKNPVLWFFDGLRSILSIPAWILAGSGVIRATTVQRFKDSRIVRFLTALIAIATLVSTIMSIVLGWAAFLDVVKRVLQIK
jgi:hypothetical protein